MGLVLVGGWLWLAYIFRSVRQISIVVGGFGFVLTGPFGFLWGFFPPAGLLMLAHYNTQFSDFFAAVFLWSIPIAFVTLILAMLWKRTEAYMVGFSVLAFFVSSLIVAERISLSDMCRTAHSLDVTEIQRMSFLQSLRLTNASHVFDNHAILVGHELQAYWSYRTRDWVFQDDGRGYFPLYGYSVTNCQGIASDAGLHN